MSFIAIPMAEERKLTFHQQLAGWRKAGAPISDDALAASRSSWRVSRLFSRIAFFFLSMFALSSFYGLCELFRLPGELLSGIAGVTLAELLVRRRFLRAGIEEAFYISGLSSLIFSIPSQGSKEGILLFALAFLFAGFRLAQTLFLGAATLLVVIYLVIKSDQVTVGGIACLLLFFVAQVAARYDHERPFLAHYFSFITAASLPAAFALFFAAFDLPEHVPYSFLVLALLIGAAAVFQATRRPDRSLMIGGAITALLAIAFLGVRLDLLPAEWELIVPGSLILVAALALNRHLRGRDIGVTSDAVSAGMEIGMVEMAASAALAAATTDRQAPDTAQATPDVDAADPSSPSFGGAGASGQY